LSGTNAWVDPGLDAFWFMAQKDHCTVTLWAKVSARRLQSVFGSSGSAPANSLLLGTTYNASRLAWNGAVGVSNLTWIGSASTQTWQHLALVLNGGAGFGSMNGSAPAALGGNAVSVAARPLLGCSSAGGTPGMFYGGAVDEFRVAAAARSADWLRAEYMTAAETGKLCSFTVELGYAVDADSDALSDRWENEHFAGTNAALGGADEDFDADGMINRDEYVAGTDPADSNSVFRVCMRETGGVWVVEMPTVAAGDDTAGRQRFYTLEESGGLTNGTWAASAGWSNILGLGEPVRRTNSTGSALFFGGSVELR
jgi:hypothetical protein